MDGPRLYAMRPLAAPRNQHTLHCVSALPAAPSPPVLRSRLHGLPVLHAVTPSRPPTPAVIPARAGAARLCPARILTAPVPPPPPPPAGRRQPTRHASQLRQLSHGHRCRRGRGPGGRCPRFCAGIPAGPRQVQPGPGGRLHSCAARRGEERWVCRHGLGACAVLCTIQRRGCLNRRHECGIHAQTPATLPPRMCKHLTTKPGALAATPSAPCAGRRHNPS